jgi:preprotein translocase subunit SecF
VVITVVIISLLTNGLVYSIEFEGGALLEYPDTAGATVAEIQDTLAGFGREDAEVQVVNGNQVSIRTQSLSELDTRRTELISALAEQAGIGTEEINILDVGPTWGKQISSKALQGLVIFLILVSLYIAFRFEWKMALSAQVALLHDILVTIGVYSLIGREVTPATVIAVLTILGYSLYDTVVIFDKVKENTESSGMVAREGYAGVVNTSLNETLMRSVNTSLVVLFPVMSLLIFGGEVLQNFAFALGIGIASGTYSSIFVASPLLSLLHGKDRRGRKSQAGTQVKRKRIDEERIEASGSTDEETLRELKAAGIIKAPVPGDSPAKDKPKSKKGSGGSKKSTTAKQRRRR